MRAARADAPWFSGCLEGMLCVGEGAVPRKPRLLDTVRDAIRIRHYSRRTERAYLGRMRRYILFHDKRHPA